MLNDFFQFFGLRENPFHISPDPRFYHSTPAHAAVLSELVYSIETRHGFVVLTGDAGTGKTTTLNYLLDWLKQRGISSSYLFHSKLKPRELLEFIVQDFGITYTSRRKGHLLAALCHWLIQRHSRGDCPVIMIDEAQLLSSETLDELRLLLNLETPTGKLVQLVLAGQLQLEERLRQPELKQLRQRVMFHCRLRQLTEEETSQYIAARLATAGATDARVFPEETIRAIHGFSSGVPRVVNMLCEHSLLRAYADQQQTVSPEIVRCVATEFDLVSRMEVVGGDAVSNPFGRLVSFSERELPAASISKPSGSAPLPVKEVAAPGAVPAPVLRQLEPEELEPVVVSLTESWEPAALPVIAVSAPSVEAAPELQHLEPQEPEPVTVPLSESREPADLPVIAVSAPSAVTAPKPRQLDTEEQVALTAAPMKLTTVEAPPFPPSVPVRPHYRHRHTLPLRLKRLGVVLLSYQQDIWRSFVHDWRSFLAFSARQKHPIATELRTKIVTPISKWLRKPITRNQASTQSRLMARPAHKR
jgi:general secretion pathway protein A